MRANFTKKQVAMRAMWALLFVVTFCTTLFGQNQALIVHDGTGYGTGAVSTLQPKLEAAGYTVTTNVGIPSTSLSGYKQIWDTQFNNTTPLSGADVTTYTGYLNGGGSLFLMGENMGFMTRNNSIGALVLAAGGGTVTFGSPNSTQTVQAPFTGPNAVTTVDYPACGGMSALGQGSAVTKDGSNLACAGVWGPGSMSNATAGTLIVVLDVNFLQPGASATLQDFTRNLIAYLAAPTPIAPAATPVPPTLLLVLAGGAAAAAMEIRRRMVG